MRRLFAHPWGWASIAPILCAIHCAVTPIFVVLAPALAPGEAIEWALLGITVILAAVALASGLSRHADMRPALPIIAGLLVWGASLMHLFHPLPEEATTIVASLTVAAGLIWNSRIHCAWKAGTAGQSCSVCEHETIPEANSVEGAPGVRPS